MSPPRPAGQLQIVEERRDSEPELKATVSRPDASSLRLDVTATRQGECRSVETTPMVQDVDTKRTTSVKIQVGNSIGAAVFGGFGIAFLPDAPPVQVGIGIGFCALGATFLAAIISNARRAHDDRETVPARASSGRPAPFQPCAPSPLSNAELTALVAGTVLRAVTGEDGHAVFDLSAPDLVHAPSARVRLVHGFRAIDVDLGRP